jgi:predicted RNase H-like HicB family nuclease
MASVAGYVQLTFKITREDDGYVAVCEELGVSTCDDSLDQILSELKALVTQHLNALERNGVRAAFFKEHGIHLHKGIPAAAGKGRRVSIPIRADEIVTRVTEPITSLVAK